MSISDSPVVLNVANSLAGHAVESRIEVVSLLCS
jgi:hypothetical protein